MNHKKNNIISKLNTINGIASIISCIIAIGTLIATVYIGKKSNDISNQVAQMDKLQTSLAYVSNFYDSIMDNSEFYDIWLLIDAGKQIPNDAKKGSFIDNFEGLGDKYCNGLVYLRNIKTYKYMFDKTCQNEQIIDLFKGKKNTFSKICLDLGFLEGMGEYYKENGTCVILE